MSQSAASPKIIGRLAGLFAILMLADFIAFLFVDPHNTLHANPGSGYVLGWAAANGGLLKVEGLLDGLINTLFAILLLLLITLMGVRGPIVRIIEVMVGAAVALQWAHAGMLYALAELAPRGGADAGVLALYTLGYTMDYSDSIPISVSLAGLGILMLRSRAMPAPLGWLTLVAAAPGFVSTPAAIAGLAILNPISVLLSLIWALVVGITLLVKPVWGSAMEERGAIPAVDG